MNLMIISNNLSRPSYRQRFEIYLDTLRKNEINCDVFQIPQNILSRINLFKNTANYDCTILQKKRLNFIEVALLKKHAKKIIYDFDDAVMYNPNKPNQKSFLRWHRFCKTVKLADAVIAGNSYLAQLAKKYNNAVTTIPTGLDTSEYKIQNILRNELIVRLVWIGSKSTLDYLKEISPALEQIGSEFKNVILRIICDDFFELKNMKVEKKQWSLQTQVQDLTTCDIGLSPLPDNRFTRGKCGFKILQYAAAGLPVVASPVGTNCDYIKNGETGLFATNIKEWVECIKKLILDLNLRQTMGAKNLAHSKNFDAAIIGEKLVSVIKNCVNTQNPIEF